MSVSSHLTPEPERRLWLILESMQSAVVRADLKLALLAALALSECALVRGGPPWALGPLLVTLVAAAAGLLPLRRPVRWAPWLEAPRAKLGVDDSLVSAPDLAKYTVGELINRLDRYLGGGITATQYYEDIVREILWAARTATRKQRLQSGVGLVALLAQAAFAAALLAR